jgi:hypothetical protein
VRLESFTIEELHAFVLALRHMAQRYARGRTRNMRTIYDSLADRLFQVLRRAEQTTFAPLQVAGTKIAPDSTLPAEPEAPLLALSVEELEHLWIAVVEERAALGGPRAPKESLESFRYRKRQAVVVRRTTSRVDRIYRRARSAPAARVGVP